MIKTRISRKIRGSAAAASNPSGGFASSSGQSDYARTAGYADRAGTADRAETAAEADHAARAHDLDDPSPADLRYVSRLKDDRVAGKIEFAERTVHEKGLRSDGVIDAADTVVAREGVRFGDTFVPGIAGGQGGFIDGSGYGELAGLSLREFLEVPELRYNRVEVSTGTEWHAPGGGVIGEGTPSGSDTGQLRLKLEEGEAPALKAGDICLGIWHFEDEERQPLNSSDDYDSGTGDFRFSGFCSVYFTISSESPDGSFYYRLRPGYTVHPQPGMHFVAYGSFTDPARRRSRYSTRTYERYLDGVSDWTYTPANIRAQFGDLSNLSINGVDMKGYSAYLNNIYMTGVMADVALRRWLDISTTVVNEDSNGNRTPRKVSITAWEQTGNGDIRRVADPDLRFVESGIDDPDTLIVDTEIDTTGNDIFGTYYWYDGGKPVASVSLTLVRDGKQGAQGKQGIDGCVLRVTEWQSGKRYCNGTETDTQTGLRFKDIATSGSGHYVCKVSHDSLTTNRPGTAGGSGYWDTMNSLAPIYTPLVVANEAAIRLINSGEIVVTDGNGKVSGRFGAGETPLWIGGTADSSVFRVDAKGRLRLKGADSDSTEIATDPNTGDIQIKNSAGRVLTTITGRSIEGGGAVSSSDTEYNISIPATNGFQHLGSNGISQTHEEWRVCEFTIPKEGAVTKEFTVEVSALVQAYSRAVPTGLGGYRTDEATCKVEFYVARLDASGNITGYVEGSDDEPIKLTLSAEARESGYAEAVAENRKLLTQSVFTVDGAKRFAVMAKMDSRFGTAASGSVSALTTSTRFLPTFVRVTMNGTSVYKAALHRDGITLQGAVNDYFTAYYREEDGFHVTLENSQAKTETDSSRIVGLGLNANGLVARVARSGTDNGWVPFNSWLSNRVESILRAYKLI